MNITKADTVKMALQLPGCMISLAYSHTCYEGVFPPCGKCPACKLRAKGFEEAYRLFLMSQLLQNNSPQFLHLNCLK